MTMTDAGPAYVSSAFYSQYNLILLGGSALFSLASASLVPLSIGLAAELLWLGLGSRSAPFRRYVDARAEGERKAKLDDEVMLGMRSLDAEHTSRLLAVGQNVSLILMRAEAASVDPAERAAWSELEQLRPAFLRYCRVQERLTQRLHEMALSPPEQEVARLSQAYAAEKDLGLRLTLHQTMKLAQRKIEQQGRMLGLKRQIELKLSLVEQSLAHLRGQQQLGVPTIALLHDVHTIGNSLSGASALESELNEVAPPSLAPAISR
jgi:hypothetical protein